MLPAARRSRMRAWRRVWRSPAADRVLRSGVAESSACSALAPVVASRPGRSASRRDPACDCRRLHRRRPVPARSGTRVAPLAGRPLAAHRVRPAPHTEARQEPRSRSPHGRRATRRAPDRWGVFALRSLDDDGRCAVGTGALSSHCGHHAESVFWYAGAGAAVGASPAAAARISRGRYRDRTAAAWPGQRPRRYCMSRAAISPTWRRRSSSCFMAPAAPASA